MQLTLFEAGTPCPKCGSTEKYNHEHLRGRCRSCHNKRRREFERAKKASPSGVVDWQCIQCGSRMTWQGERRGKRNTICTACAPNLRFRMLVHRYAVDKAMFEAMYFEQDGKCAIASCVREAVSVDHCHRSGRVRGLLCQGCNIAIGVLEGTGWLVGARAYLAE